jgi:Tol biopolymer transport system component
MADRLDERLRSLDQLRPPDLWGHIQEREPGGEPTEPSQGRRIAIAAVALLVAAAAIGLSVKAFTGGARPAEPYPIIPKANGRIAFVAGEHPLGPSNIYTVEPDGSGLVQLTHDAFTQDKQPAWSPDGSRIAFVHGGEFPPTNLYLMNADGSGQVQLTHGDQYQNSPTWSPDGSRIAIARGGNDTDYDLFVMNTDGSGDRQITDGPGSEVEPDWSPDGTKLVYAASERNSGLTNLYMLSLNGGDPIRLTTTELYDSSPKWSPDGRTVAFLRAVSDGPTSIELVDADGANLREVFTCPRSADCDALQGLSWAPDGTRIAFALFRRVPGQQQDQADLFTIAVDGSDLQQFTQAGLDLQVCCPSWQPVALQTSPPPQARANGMIGFVGGEEPGSVFGSSNLYWVEPDGSGLHQATGDASERIFDPAWSPDGGEIAFIESGGEGGSSDVFVTGPELRDALLGHAAGVPRLTKANIRQLTHGMVAGSPAWSPNGTEIAFGAQTGELDAGGSNDNEIFAVDADGSGLHQLTDSPGRATGPSWSPDGSRIAYLGTLGGQPGPITTIFVMNADGTGAQELSVGEGPVRQVSWSPDGMQLLFTKEASDGNRLFVSDPDGSSIRRLCPDECNDVLGAVWSPDGSGIALGLATGDTLGDRHSQLFTMNPDGSGLELVLGTPFSVCCPTWQPIAAEPPAPVPTSLSPSPAASPVSPLPNGSLTVAGREVAGLGGQDGVFYTGVYSVDPGGGSMQPVITDSAGLFDPSWSRDGLRLAYVRSLGEHGPRNIVVVNADGSGLAQVTDSTYIGDASGFNEHPSWSPDGTRIVFASGRDTVDVGRTNMEIYSINADGTGLTRLTDRAGQDMLPAWSPDGASIAFVRDRQLALMNTDGSGIRTLWTCHTSDLCGLKGAPVWSPGGDRLAFVVEDNDHTWIEVLDTSSLGSQVLFDCREDCLILGPSLAWSPDGTTLAFIRWDSPSGPPYVATIRADGSHLERVETGSVWPFDVAWRPSSIAPLSNGVAYVADSVTSLGRQWQIVVRSSDRVDWCVEGPASSVCTPDDYGSEERVAVAGPSLDQHQLVFGAVTPDADRVRMILDDGRTIDGWIDRIPPAIGAPFDVFAVDVDGITGGVVQALDKQGRILGQANLVVP